MAGFSNGVIRVHSAETGKKMIEIAAHGRSVTALDVATDSGLVSYYNNIAFLPHSLQLLYLYLIVLYYTIISCCLCLKTAPLLCGQ